MYQLFFRKPSRKKLVDWASPVITLLAAVNAYTFVYLGLSNLQFHIYNKQYIKGMNNGIDDAIWEHPYHLSPDFTPDKPNKKDAYFNGFIGGMLAATLIIGIAKTIYHYKENPEKNDYLYPLIATLLTIGMGTATISHEIKMGLSGNSPYDQGYYYGYQSQCDEHEKYCNQTVANPHTGEISFYNKLFLILSSLSFAVIFLLMLAANVLKGQLNNTSGENCPLREASNGNERPTIYL